jgi:hypothetical protein
MKTLFAVALSLAIPAAAVAQEPAKQESTRMQDEQAINAALEAVYGAISGGVGEERDWDAMRALFTPEARLTAITANGLRGGTVEEYIERSGPFLVKNGFAERQLASRIEIYGDLAHAWSSYGGTFTQEDGTPGKVRGINSFQLARQPDGRWLVQSIFWQAEAPERPLPSDMTGE